MAFTASKLHQCQKFVEKLSRVLTEDSGRVFPSAVPGIAVIIQLQESQACSHYSTSTVDSSIPTDLGRHCLLPLPVV